MVGGSVDAAHAVDRDVLDQQVRLDERPASTVSAMRTASVVSSVTTAVVSGIVVSSERIVVGVTIVAPSARVKPVPIHAAEGTPRPPPGDEPVGGRAGRAGALFVRQGFVETTVDDIAEAAGISRRTFFRYFRSKNDVVWGDFDALLGELDRCLATGAHRPSPDGDPSRRGDPVQLPPAEDGVAAHRQRMALILYVPALQAHSTLRYAAWRAVVAQFAARRLRAGPDDLGPRLVGHVALAAAVAAYEQWLATSDADLAALLGRAFDAVEVRFADDDRHRVEERR